MDGCLKVDEIWSDTPASERPKIIGPDNDFDWRATGAHKGSLSTAQILSGLAPFLHAFTYHQYGGGGETDARAFAVYDR